MLRSILPLTLIVLVGCAVSLDPAPVSDVDRGPWPSGGITTLAIEAGVGQVVLDGSANRSVLQLSDTSQLESTTLEAGVLTVVANGDVQLLAPAGLEWSITTTTGSVSVSGMGGSGHVAVATGEVACAGLTGSLSVQVEEAATVGIHLDALPSGGVVIVESMVGPIALDVPADTSAALVASTGSGGVDVTGVDFAGVLLEGSADGVLAGGDGSFRLLTGAGAVSVNGYGQ